MPVFDYAGKSQRGERCQGRIVAPDPKGAVRLLREQRVVVTRLRENHSAFSKKRFWSPFLGMSRVTGKDLATFTHQCASMIKAGIPLVASLDVLASHSENHQLQQVLTTVRRDIEGGAMFAAGLQKHPKIFSDFYVHMIEVGETTGMLDKVLERLALHLEQLDMVKGRILSTLAYPFTLLTVAIGVLAFLLVWVIPLFRDMFSEFGQSLPWLTQMVIEVSALIASKFWVGISLLVVMGLMMKWIYQKPEGRFFVDGLVLRLPLVGTLVQKTVVVHFTRTLGGLLHSGVPILEGLKVAGRTTGNAVFAAAIRNASIRVREGDTVAKPLADTGLFPGMMTKMIEVGETTGSLDSMLEKIADLYEREVNRALATLTALFEPLVMLIIGLGIGVIVIAMYLPIFMMGSLMG